MFRGICDCHVHVFEPRRFAFAAERAYTPGPATVQALSAFHAGLGADRVVLVQPSVYGSDNACLLEALRLLGPGRARGIAVVDLERVAQADLQRLHAAGVRGLRLNLDVRGETDAATARRQIANAVRVADMPGWCLQIHARAELIVALAGQLATFPSPVVLDHFAGIRRPAAQRDCLQTLLALARCDKVHVKASAPYKAADGLAAAAVLAKAFHDAAPTRLLWGSDWPHTGGGDAGGRTAAGIEPFRTVDDVAALAAIAGGLDGDEARWNVFAGNAANLYGFGDEPRG